VGRVPVVKYTARTYRIEYVPRVNLSAPRTS
jgi:hypothetical protein